MVAVSTGRALRIAGALAAGALVAALAPPNADAAASCAQRNLEMGEWRTYGHDYSNTRHQTRGSLAGDDAPLLTPAWTFSSTEAGGEGDITGTPTVGYGCVYVATSGGWVFALNAESGERVWKAEVPEGGGVNSSVTVTRRRLYVAVSRTQRGVDCEAGTSCIGPYVVAFDRRSGALEWTSRPLDTQPGADVFGSPVLFRGTLMLGVSGGAAELGDEADRYAFQGSMNFLRARTGKRLRKTWTIHPPNRPDDEFAGAGIWSTPAVDTRAGVAYAGTANPFRPQVEHDHANAVLKFDVDPESRTFGRILDSYKGNIDEYVPAFSELPCFDIPGNPPPYYPQGIGACGDIDLDFGASPNLFRDATGRLVVGNGQKSGVYHAFDAKTMEPLWSQVVGPPTPVGGIVGSTAYDGRAIYGPVTVPGYTWSIGAEDGALRWVGPIGDGAHWGEPVAVSNGVVYSVDLTGFLDAFDARTGLPLAKRPLLLGGTNSPLSLSWGGVSVARNTVYAAVGLTGLPDGYVVAFRPGGATDVPEDALETIGGIGGGGVPGVPAAGGIVAGPGAASVGYATPVMTTQVGGPLSFTNLDVVQHDVRSEDESGGKPLFGTPLIGFGESAPVEGLDGVESGRTYGFYCSVHPGMQGDLIVR